MRAIKLISRLTIPIFLAFIILEAHLQSAWVSAVGIVVAIVLGAVNNNLSRSTYASTGADKKTVAICIALEMTTYVVFILWMIVCSFGLLDLPVTVAV